MAAATDPQPLTPLWWLNKLQKQLSARQTAMQLMDRYYSGDHPLPFLTPAHASKMRSQFRLLLEDSKTNFARLVVDTVEERLRVDGFRLSASGDPVTDQSSWDIWQANQLDSESQAGFVEALVKGISYLSVWEVPEGGKYPSIAVEDASQTIVGYVPGTNCRQRAAALKIWTDDWTGMERANIYLPDGIVKFQRKTVTGGYGPATQDQAKWIEQPDDFVPNRIGIVPIVPLRNRPRLLQEGESELSDVYPIQNRINSFTFLLALAGYFGAHKQRWAVGLELMEDGQGRKVAPFDIAVDKLFVSEDEKTKFGEFTETDLSGYIKTIDQMVQHIAITTRTPKHYLLPEGQEPSGDAIQSAESGLIKKIEKKQRPFGEGLEEAMRIARMFAGDSDSPVDSEVVWADPKTESLAVLTDGVIKQYAEGLIPWEAALEKLGYTQAQIQRFSKMRMGDALMKGIANPDAPAPTQVQAPTVESGA